MLSYMRAKTKVRRAAISRRLERSVDKRIDDPHADPGLCKSF